MRPVARSIIRNAVSRAISDPGVGGGGGHELEIQALFAGSELGAYYNPYNLSAQFKTARDTVTPTVGQTAALVLDTRKPITYGPQLWPMAYTVNEASITTSDGGMSFNFTASTSGKGVAINLAPLGGLVGDTYEVKFRISGRTAGIFRASVGSTSSGNVISANGSYTYTTVISGAVVVSFTAVDTTNTFTIDNISIRSVSGRSQITRTDANAPLLAKSGVMYWHDYDGVNDSLATVFPNLGSNVTIIRAVPGVGTTILTGQTIGAGTWSNTADHAGLLIINRALTSGETERMTEIFDIKAGLVPPIPAAAEYSVEGYWMPPPEPSNVAGRDWTYAQLLAQYDALVAVEPRLTKHRYEDGLGNPILSSSGGFELFHYVYEPPGYDKTFFLQAAIHGSEKDCRLTLFRMMQIMLTKRNTNGYRAWQEVYDRCRLIIIPLANPHSNDAATFLIPYQGEPLDLNPNRNYDFNHQKGATSGSGGNAPFDTTETQHTRDVFNLYGAQNIDLAVDYHDGGTVIQHYWINYAIDAPNRQPMEDFVDYMLAAHGIAPEDAIIPDARDTGAPGTTAGWYSKTMGVPATTNEWIGGIFGYDFGSAHLTHSLQVRSNMLFIALADDNITGWKVNEAPGAPYFHFDFPMSFTRKALREEGAEAITKVNDADIYARWDALQAANPALIAKSASLGNNADGMAVHTYTFGSGPEKVLYVGGVMRYGGTHKIDEYAIYQLVEYLCNDFIVDQSAHLTNLRDNYTIIVLPCIDNVAGNGDSIQRTAGLNQVAIQQRWVIDGSNKAVPAAGANGADNHGVQIIKALIDANTDAKCIVSGGEIMTGYALNSADYTTTFQTHFVVPRNMAFDHAAYKTHLETNRSELVVVENTQGFTFGDYAWDWHGIPVYFVQLKVSDRFTEWADDHTLTEQAYLHSNYEAGRRMANIVNLFVA